jgi:hypothetical protein
LCECSFAQFTYLLLAVSEGEYFPVLGVIVRKIEGTVSAMITVTGSSLQRQGNKLHAGFVPYPFSL